MADKQFPQLGAEWWREYAQQMSSKPCTCHPDDRPPVCQHRYALQECRDTYEKSQMEKPVVTAQDPRPTVEQLAHALSVLNVNPNLSATPWYLDPPVVKLITRLLEERGWVRSIPRPAGFYWVRIIHSPIPSRWQVAWFSGDRTYLVGEGQVAPPERFEFGDRILHPDESMAVPSS